jgi:hypothetical protein
VLQVTLRTNFKSARFDAKENTAILRQTEADIEALALNVISKILCFVAEIMMFVWKAAETSLEREDDDLSLNRYALCMRALCDTRLRPRASQPRLIAAVKRSAVQGGTENSRHRREQSLHVTDRMFEEVRRPVARSANGATPSLPRIPTTVSSPSLCGPC